MVKVNCIGENVQTFAEGHPSKIPPSWRHTMKTQVGAAFAGPLCFTRCPGGYGVMKALDTNFLSIELSSSMVTDHFLSGYISCLVHMKRKLLPLKYYFW